MIPRFKRENRTLTVENSTKSSPAAGFKIPAAEPSGNVAGCHGQRACRAIAVGDGTVRAFQVAAEGKTGHSPVMTDSPYLFRAADHPMVAASGRLNVREAKSGFGIALRYQERAPDPPDVPEPNWCETGHSIFILAGHIRYQFDDHTIEAGPGDMLHIPAGLAHRHKPRVAGPDVVRYVLTEFD